MFDTRGNRLGFQPELDKNLKLMSSSNVYRNRVTWDVDMIEQTMTHNIDAVKHNIKHFFKDVKLSETTEKLQIVVSTGSPAAASGEEFTLNVESSIFPLRVTKM